MDKQTTKIIRPFIKKLTKRYHVKKLILFGSRARGDNLKTSDFDFIIVSDDFKGVPFPKRMGYVHHYWDGPLDLEPLCYTGDELKRLKNVGIIKKALKEGKIIRLNDINNINNKYK